jgi:hypothetical protein
LIPVRATVYISFAWIASGAVGLLGPAGVAHGGSPSWGVAGGGQGGYLAQPVLRTGFSFLGCASRWGWGLLGPAGVAHGGFSFPQVLAGGGQGGYLAQPVLRTGFSFPQVLAGGADLRSLLVGGTYRRIPRITVPRASALRTENSRWAARGCETCSQQVTLSDESPK